MKLLSSIKKMRKSRWILWF